MPAQWFIVPGLVGLFGLLLLLGAIGALFRGRVFKMLRGVVSGSLLIALAAAASLLALNVQSYARLTWEKPIATVTVRETAQPGTYDVLVAETERPAHVYALRGEQWQLDARVITWKPWANILGLDTQYELQRLWARRLGGEGAGAADRLDIITERPGIDMLDLSRQLGDWAFLQEREFGSAVYMPLVDGAIFEVRISQDAMVVDPSNAIAKEAIEGGALAREVPPSLAQERARGLRITLPWTKR